MFLIIVIVKLLLVSGLVVLGFLRVFECFIYFERVKIMIKIGVKIRVCLFVVGFVFFININIFF